MENSSMEIYVDLNRVYAIENKACSACCNVLLPQKKCIKENLIKTRIALGDHRPLSPETVIRITPKI